MTNTNEVAAPSEALANQVRRGRPPRDRAENSGPDRKLEGRAERVPLGVRRPKLNAEIREGYVGRWVNDDGNRVQDALKGGWDFVLRDSEAKSDDASSRIAKDVGSKSNGTRLIAYLMEIRKDWYDEDQAAKQSGIDATENLIRRGDLVQKSGVDGAYTKVAKVTRA
jgi:hypothetical protein